MAKNKKKRGLGKSLTEMGLAALLGGDLKASLTDDLLGQNRLAQDRLRSDFSETKKSKSKELADFEKNSIDASLAEGFAKSLPASAAGAVIAGELSDRVDVADTAENAALTPGLSPGSSPGSSLGSTPDLDAVRQKEADQHQQQNPSLQTFILEVAIDQLQPGTYQPRRFINDDHLQELASSIRQQGIVQPLVVRRLAGDTDGQNLRYEIVAGERRWRAAKLVGLKAVPVIVRDLDDRDTLAIALIENLQREDLNAIDQAVALQRLLSEFDLTHLEIAELVGKSRATVSNFLRLLNLDVQVQQLVQQGDLEMGHARALLAVGRDEQSQWAELIIARSLTVRQTEKMLQQQSKPMKAEENIAQDEQAEERNKHQLQQMQLQLSQCLDCKVRLQAKKGKQTSGKLTIHYRDEEQLQELTGRLTQKASES